MHLAFGASNASKGFHRVFFDPMGKRACVDKGLDLREIPAVAVGMGRIVRVFVIVGMVF